MAFEKLIAKAKRIGLGLARKEIDRILAKPKPKGVEVEAKDDAIVLKGKRLRKRRATDPDVRNIAR